tara:strand:+ start:51 stop:302 length:252 start_codon:yes stop_codon:yes gene_type:complete
MTENTCSNNKGSAMTEVKTVYARIAVGLLALNFLLTGYVVTQLNKTVQSQIETRYQTSGPSSAQPLNAPSDQDRQNPGETREQ